MSLGRGRLKPCSRDALSQLVRDTDGLPQPEPGRLGDQLADLGSSGDTVSQDRARKVLRVYGAALGALLATLKHPDTPGQQGDNPIRRAYLEHWLGVGRVWLGGGILVRDNASEILAGARELLASANISLDVRVGRGPTILALLGAARMAPPRDGHVLVADAGHTSMKAAVAVVKDGALARLETLAPMPVPLRRDPNTVEAGIVDLLAALVGKLDIEPGRHHHVVLSVASYIDDGVPVDDGRSIYGRLAPARLRGLLAGRTGCDLGIEFVHDGTAAAFGIADPEPSAVVTIGTWLGVGFTPACRPLLGGDPILLEVAGRSSPR